MTDIPGNCLWPLALMGWLAAFPPLPRDARAQPLLDPVEAARGMDELARGEPSAGQRTLWLREARALYGNLSAEQRDRLRRRRKPGTEAA